MDHTQRSSTRSSTLRLACASRRRVSDSHECELCLAPEHLRAPGPASGLVGFSRRASPTLNDGVYCLTTRRAQDEAPGRA